MPPFTEEHEELRESIRRFVLKELRPHVQQWEDDEWFPNEVFHKMAAVGFLGLKYPEEYGGEGGDYLHDAVLSEELGALRLGRPRRRDRRAHRDRHAAGVEVRHRRAEGALPRPRDPRREDRGARHHRAGRGLRRRGHPHVREEGGRRLRRERLEDVHHERRARGLPRHRRQDDAGGRPPRPVVPDPREGHGGLLRVAEAEEDGLARVRHGRAGVPGRLRPRREPARGGEQGLLPDHGQLPVGAAA